MELSELRRLVREGEHLHLEFKRKANHPERIAREVVAFANADGGKLLIGVDDDGEIYGSKTPEEDAFELTRTFEKLIVPRLKVQLTYVPVNARRSVLVYSIRESRRKPHFVREDGKKTAFVRVRDMSVQASREMIILMKYAFRKKGVSFVVGDKEQALIRHLENFSKTTLEETRKQLSISKRKASDLLITLVRAGLIQIHPTDKEDFFTLQKDAFQ